MVTGYHNWPIISPPTYCYSMGILLLPLYKEVRQGHLDDGII